MQIPSRPIIYRLSKFISNFFNPLMSFLIYYLFVSYKNYSFSEAIQRFLPLLLIIMLPTILWISWNVRKGHYNNMDVSDRKKRNSLYIFIIGVMLLYLAYVKLFASHRVDWEILFLFFLLVVMHISNFFIKSSMHTALNLYTAALFFVIEPRLGLIWFFISVIVGISRVILGRHSIKEVLMGGFLSLLISFIYLYTQIQFQH